MINQIILNKMNKEVTKYIYKDENEPVYVIFTGDSDGISSLGAMRKRFKNLHVVGFWHMPDYQAKETIHKLYLQEGLNKIPDDTIFLDLDTYEINKRNYPCIGNHCTELSQTDQRNPLSCNLNSVLDINRYNYTNKYNMGAVHLLYGLYDIPIPNNRNGKALLCLIDSVNGAYYHENEEFKINCVGWLDLLGLGELADFMADVSDKRIDFERLIKLLGLSKKITINEEGYFQTDMNVELMGKLLELDLSLPTDKFILHKQFEQKVLRGGQIPREKPLHTATGALTGFNMYCYSEEVPMPKEVNEEVNGVRLPFGGYYQKLYGYENQEGDGLNANNS